MIPGVWLPLVNASKSYKIISSQLIVRRRDWSEELTCQQKSRIQVTTNMQPS